MIATNFNPKRIDVMLTNSIFIAFFCLYRSYCCMDILRLFQRCWNQQENHRLHSHNDFWSNRIPVFTMFFTLKLNAQSKDIKINKRHLLFKVLKFNVETIERVDHQVVKSLPFNCKLHIRKQNDWNRGKMTNVNIRKCINQLTNHYSIKDVKL